MIPLPPECESGALPFELLPHGKYADLLNIYNALTSWIGREFVTASQFLCTSKSVE